ncbi:hypothetical protein QQS21_008647 [Conoideocrella luteorostrata]|uniref:Helicase C-terminal domain-containing protein n=1 Tax=Conoideocrella luteorostrata TaxID=1105319 RepID=A0AAJ0CKT6_9HYPO|nr:hypothetical protein QQS21_008647 [Conoideocrella luteorostrata]
MTKDNNSRAVSSTVQLTSDEGISTIVCFGMVPSISGRCDRKDATHTLSSPFEVQLDSSNNFSAKDYPGVSGQILSEHGQMIQGLLDEKTLNLYISCTIDDSQTSETKKTTRISMMLPCFLEITVYGPSELFDEIGTWFEQYQIYLQDPRDSHLEAKYYNPHRLSSDDIASCLLVSEVIDQGPKALQLETITDQPDLLDMLSSHEDLEEAPQPVAINRELRRHQKQALTFMLRRERGWAFHDQKPDVWEIVDTERGRFFLNRISNAHQSEEPPQCYGGIVADPMGLGKTLTMISLVATDIGGYNTLMHEGEEEELSISATLIVVPPSPHLIRNGNSKMSQAICALSSKSRWAVTGTPIQNRLGDLATLFKFIRAHPYTDRRCFDTDISRLWKTGEYQEAIKRLKRLSACLLLRRAKGTVSLPPRHDTQCPVDFTHDERALYNKLRQQAIISIDEALQREFESSRAGMYVNVLQQIESLRLVCNLGLHYHTRHGKVSQYSQVIDNWTTIAQSTFNVQRDMGHLVCSQCSSTLEITETLLEDPAVTQHHPVFFSCLKFVCGDCTQKTVQAVTCGHHPRCPMAHVSTSGSALESSLPEIQPLAETVSIKLPSKVEALITDIQTLPPNEKCIVFSTWRLTLDIVEAGLRQSSLSSIRFDGKVPQKERHNIVDRFKTDSSIRVMLLTLSCGAAGLTLTVATRAYLLEPHWNPTLEEQALARIHRIGQTQKVTTVRFFVRDSFEQQVMEVQESKKYLAGLLLSPHDDGQADENLGRLRKLLSLIQ